jgi:hypothetical protein
VGVLFVSRYILIVIEEIEVVQDKNHSFIDFSERTEALAVALGKNVSELPVFIGISPSMLHSYRSGKLPISAKAWRKLEAAELKIVDSQTLKQTQKIKETHYPDDHSGYGVQILKDAEKPITAADFAETKDRIKTLEEKLDLLLKHLGAKP